MNRNRRGSAAGWVVLVVILAALVALVSWKMLGGKGGPNDRARYSTTQQD